MRVVVYQMLSDDRAFVAPFMAFILLEGNLLPIRFAASSEQEARDKATAHWDAAMAKKASAKPRGRPPKEGRAAQLVEDDDVEEAI